MKVSLKLAQQYGTSELDKIPESEIIQRIGAQLGAIEEIEHWGPQFEGALIVKIVSCQDHPNADSLHVCLIDDGGVVSGVERDAEQLVQVVCGAPNVCSDMLAVWLPPGAVVPSTRQTNEPFVLSTRELRGYKSNGMLASAKELGLGDDHSGIVELPEDDRGQALRLGAPLADYFDLTDTVIDCENKMFTHRPDCFGTMGVAREMVGIAGRPFLSPDWYKRQVGIASQKNGLPVEVNVQADNVARFMAVSLDNLSQHPTPFWMKIALLKAGIRPLSSIVDITNFVMLVSGQPMHAFDYHKLQKLSGKDSVIIGPRAALPNESLTLLGGKKVDLSKQDVVIDVNGTAVALGGVMGGADSEVDENTTAIVLECATFDMYAIRRTSMRHGLFTEAVTRYNKGQSPWQNGAVLSFAVSLLQDICGAQLASEVQDVLSKSVPPQASVEVESSFINSRLGTSITAEAMAVYLRNVEFDIDIKQSQADGSGTLLVKPPFWRTDIERSEDVLEEIGRLHGYDKIPITLPRRPIVPADIQALYQAKTHIRAMLSSFGANELLTYSFVPGKLLQNAGQDTSKAYHIRNALSPDLQYFRLSLVPSLLDKVAQNIKSLSAEQAQESLVMFEINKAINRKCTDIAEPSLPLELHRLSIVLANKNAQKTASYYELRSYVDGLLAKLHITNVQFVPLSHVLLDEAMLEAARPFEEMRTAALVCGDVIVGLVGELKPSVRKAFKLPAYCAAAELDAVALLNLSSQQPSYKLLSRFPATTKDVCLRVGALESYSDLRQLVESAVSAITNDGLRVEVALVDIYQNEAEDNKQVTFRFTIDSLLQTLTSEAANQAVSSLVEKITSSGDVIVV